MLHHSIWFTQDKVIHESFQSDERATGDLSPEEVTQMIIQEWNSLQELPSYVETQLLAHKDLIEAIASQS